MQRHHSRALTYEDDDSIAKYSYLFMFQLGHYIDLYG